MEEVLGSDKLTEDKKLIIETLGANYIHKKGSSNL